VEQEQNQQRPDEGIKKRQKDLKRPWEPFAVRVNPEAGVCEREGEYEGYNFTDSFHHAGVAGGIEKEPLYHNKRCECMDGREQNQEDDFFNHFRLCSYYLETNFA
jgi:hypothetical protein